MIALRAQRPQARLDRAPIFGVGRFLDVAFVVLDGAFEITVALESAREVEEQQRVLMERVGAPEHRRRLVEASLVVGAFALFEEEHGALKVRILFFFLCTYYTHPHVACEHPREHQGGALRDRHRLGVYTSNAS